MTVTMQAYKAVAALGVIVRWLDTPLRPSLALRLRSIARALDEVARDVVAEEERILREHGALEDDKGFVPQTGPDGRPIEGTWIIDDPEKREACRAALAELRRSEVSVRIDAGRVTVEELEAAGLTLSPRDADLLADLLTTKEESNG